ncbi:MAG TPA: hypothetical protein VML96_08540 [Egibacteraceae bacterium]|nr:hypothetical protein [Egibacteraceae bacterium]
MHQIRELVERAGQAIELRQEPVTRLDRAIVAGRNSGDLAADRLAQIGERGAQG